VNGCFLATKVSGEHLRHDQVLHAADASLRLLGTAVIDLYQIHWPNPRVPIKETMQAMETLVDRGQVRYIGVSNFSHAGAACGAGGDDQVPHCRQSGAVQPQPP